MTNEEINLAVATIAGWTSITEWNPSPKDDKPVKTWQVTNLAHPELGGFIPDYANDLNAITLVFRKHLNIFYEVSWMPTQNRARANAVTGFRVDAETEALALCKLLLVIVPNPIAPKATVIDATFG
jgi:hypothetical protein